MLIKKLHRELLFDTGSMKLKLLYRPIHDENNCFTIGLGLCHMSQLASMKISDYKCNSPYNLPYNSPHNMPCKFSMLVLEILFCVTRLTTCSTTHPTTPVTTGPRTHQSTTLLFTIWIYTQEGFALYTIQMNSTLYWICWCLLCRSIFCIQYYTGVLFEQLMTYGCWLFDLKAIGPLDAF